MLITTCFPAIFVAALSVCFFLAASCDADFGFLLLLLGLVSIILVLTWRDGWRARGCAGVGQAIHRHSLTITLSRYSAMS